MTTFQLILHSTRQQETFADCTQFVGEDTSGQFGLLAHHAPMATILESGLARFSLSDGQWRYLAMPGGVVHFHHNRLHISCHHYLYSQDFEAIASQFRQQIAEESREITEVRHSLHTLEQTLMQKLWREETR